MLDEVINEVKTDSNNKKSNYKENKEKRETAYKMINSAIEELKSSTDFFKTYLDVQSRFDKLTSRNALLIAKQMPTAIQLREKEKWQELNATFINGEPKTITILEPKEPYTTKDGRTITSFNAKDMIDISETNMKYEFKAYDKKILLQALISGCPFDIKAVDELNDDKMCELNSEEKVLYICRSKDIDLMFSSVATELAKVGLYEEIKDPDINKANCISYMVCRKYGIDNTFDGVSEMIDKYSAMESKDVINDLTAIKNVLSDINNKMVQYLSNRNKEPKNNDYER